ncbi:MAG: IS21 family transposase [Planctomycetes bacterium]|nr:IS21 family transposase [Planctomycetota bacterium]
MSQVLECKQLRAQGHSIRAIAKSLAVSRNTVRGYLRGERRPGEYCLVEGRASPVSALIAPRVREMLIAERAAATPRKQLLTAARIGRLLLAEGLVASESTLRSVVRQARLDVRDPLRHAFVPLVYAPGEDAQVDFFEGEVDDVKLGRVKCFVLLVRACYSGRTFAYAAPNQTREALFEGLMRAFEFFGGVFRKLWFDNLTPAVKKVLEGRRRIEQRAFACFRAHYGFEVEFCAPGKGNEKGGVEGCVKYSRHEILSPIPTITSRADLQALCDAWMEREMSRVIKTREHAIGEAWLDEVPQLIALPATRFDASLPRMSKVTPRSWISLGTVFYSVPVEWAGRFVQVRQDAELVVIIGPGGQRVSHARSYVMHAVVLDVDHYLPLLRRKHRGLDHALPLQQFMDQVPGEWRALLAALRRDEGEIDGAQAFVDVLLLGRTYSIDAVRDAVQAALRHPQVSEGLVRFYIWQKRAEETPKPAALEYAGPAVHQGSVKDYAVLLRAPEVALG